MRELLAGVILIIICFGCSKPKVRKGLNFITLVEDKRGEIGVLPLSDSSASKMPRWLMEPNLWVKAHELDYQKYRYFLYRTGPKVNRQICEQLADARAMAMVMTLRKNMGITNDSLRGSKVIKRYWEKRKYQQSGVYSCSSLLKVSLKSLTR